MRVEAEGSGFVMGGPRMWLRLEALAILIAAGVAYAGAAFAGGGFGWWAIVLAFAPDASFAAYLFGPRVGAFVYNCAHAYIGPVILLALGGVAAIAWAIPLAMLWIAHIAFDRLLGYGLKYSSAFVDTHLGRIGK